MATTQEKRERRTWQQRLAEKGKHSSLALILIFNFWFRLVFLLLVVFVIGMSLFIPKIWTATDKDFEPVVKISGLDKVQAWSLRRTARNAQAAGDSELALHAWRGAVGNNLTDIESLTGMLEFLVDYEPKKETIGLAYGRAAWLLRLTKTNETSRALAVRVYGSYKLPGEVIGLLADSETDLPTEQHNALLKAHFEGGDMGAFAELWGDATLNESTEEELRWYRLAHLAGWGDPSESYDAFQSVKAIVPAVEQRELVGMLRLSVANERVDVAFYLESLEDLQELGVDRTSQHVLYWKLLADAGREAEAKQLAQDFAFPPENAGDLIYYADILTKLDMAEQAQDLLANGRPRFGYSTAVWIQQAEAFFKSENWTELAALAAEMRSDDRLVGTLDSYSFYLEGRAEHALKRYIPAERAFDLILEDEFPTAQFAAHVAANLQIMGYHDIALNVLVKHQDDMVDNPSYWDMVHTSGANLKDTVSVLLSAEALHRLSPDSWVTRFNYAAALISRREDPEQAMSLSFRVYSERPRFVGGQINHGLALLLNDRLDEARAILEPLVRVRMRGAVKAAFLLGWFELNFKEGNTAEAREAGEAIDLKLLYPEEANFVIDLLARLPESEA
jgi:tetratricopeptide (TPR) repeat protein